MTENSSDAATDDAVDAPAPEACVPPPPPPRRGPAHAERAAALGSCDGAAEGALDAGGDADEATDDVDDDASVGTSVGTPSRSSVTSTAEGWLTEEPSAGGAGD